MKPKGKLPKAISSGVMNLGGIPLKVYVLDNGDRVIDADDAKRFFKLLETGEAEITKGDAESFAKFIHGMETP